MPTVATCDFGSGVDPSCKPARADDGAMESCRRCAGSVFSCASSMALTGDLGSIDLVNVFQMLLLSQKTGTLVIRSRGSRSEVYLDSDSVLVPFDRDAYPTRVVKALERAGKLTAEQVARAQASLGVVQRDLFTILLQMRAVTSEDFSAAWRAEMEEEIYELFVDRAATFEFREGEAPSLPGKVVDERYRLSGSGLLMEAARRIDEWGFIRERVATDRCIFEVSNGAQALPESERDSDMMAVVRELDGTRPVTAVVARTGVKRFTVCKKLALLVELHAAYEVGRDALVERARRCLREQRGEEGLALLERALELGSDDPQAHEMAALAHQSLGRIGEACRHLALVAEALERAGQRRQAAEVHLRVRDLLPTEVRSRERLVHHWLDDPEFFKGTRYRAEDEAVELAAILRELGRAEQARALLLELATPFAKDSRLTGKLADLAVESGEPKLAVQLLVDGSDALMKAKQPAAAARLLRRVRMIEPNHEGLDSRLASCERHAALAPLRGGRLLRIGFGLVMLIGGAAGVLLYNREALASFAQLPIEERAVAGDFDGALQELERFREDYRGALTGWLIDERVEVLRSRRNSASTAAVERKALLATEQVRRQKVAERSYGEALDHLRLGDRVAALAAFDRSAEHATDPRFIAERAPAGKARELRALLDSEQQEQIAYAQAHEQQSWERMRELGMRLLARRDPRSEEAPILLPLRLVVDPPEAQITLTPPPLDGQVARSPALLLLPAGSETKVVVRCAGRCEVELSIAPERGFEQIVRLDYLPDPAFELPHRAAFPALVVGDLVVVACEDGRVIAVDSRTFEERWHQQLPELDDAAGPPTLDDVGIRIPTRKGAVVWLDATAGARVQFQSTGGTAQAAAGSNQVRLAGGMSLGADDTRVTLRDKAGVSLAVWRTPGPSDWGVAVPGGALFCCGDRLVRIVPDRVLASKSAGENGR